MVKTYNRYLLIEIESESYFPQKTIYYGIVDQLLRLYGELGLSNIEPRSILSKENYIILKCKRGMEDKVRCAILMLTSLSGNPVRARTIKISGTLKSLKPYLKYNSPNSLLVCKDTEPKELK